MKTILLIILVLPIYVQSAIAQAPKGTGKITGLVLDAETGKPVEYANVALLDPKTGKPIDGSVCDDKGKFTIHKINDGTYTLSVSFIGYETNNIENLILADRQNDINLGTLKLQTSSKVLNEVVVAGQKQLIEERVDRTIYNAEQDATTKGGDATDVLKRVPMLSVDLDGNVSMRGSQNIQVLINNKPSSIMASNVADALKQIQDNQIKSVEVITSPSAKYDAEGSAGIINIITKKNTLQGLTLNVDAGVGNRGANLGLNGSYRAKKMGFSLGGFGRANYNIKGNFENQQTTFESLSDTVATTNIQAADTRNKMLFGNYTLGWDYDINDKNSLVASARIGARNGINYQDNLYTLISDENGSTSSLRNVESKNLNNSLDLSLTYTHLFEKPQRELSILGNYSRNNGTNNFVNLIQQSNGIDDPSGFKNLNDSYNEEITIQADYQTPIADNQMLEFGGKNIMRKVFSDYMYYADTEGDGSYIPSPNSILTNNLNYDQNIVASYLSYTYTTKNSYSIKAGARYEYTTIKAYSQTEDDIAIPEYGAFVPGLNVSKKLKSGNAVKAAYNRRIQRPSMRFLNPNIQASNPYDVTYGNPNLDPEYTNNFEVSYSTLIKGTSINISGFWRNTNNGIQSIRTVETTTDNIQRVSTTYANIGQEDAIGTNIFVNVSIGKLMLNGGTDIYYTRLDNKNPDEQYNASNSGWVASGRMFGSYNLTKGWGFQFFGFYRGRQVQLQGSQGGMGFYNFGIKKDFNNKKGSIGIGAENFFAQEMKIRSNVTSPLVNKESLNVMRNMGFRVSLSYRIGKMSMDARPKRRKSINNDDLKDGGDGGGMDMGGGQSQQSQRGNSTGVMMVPPSAQKQPQKNVSADTAKATVDATGIWTYTMETQMGATEGRLTIIKNDGGYSGTVFSSRNNQEIPLTSVTVSGNELTANYTSNFGGNEVPVTIKGPITGDELNATMSIGTFRTLPLKAKRNK